jgi:hypothetical protein
MRIAIRRGLSVVIVLTVAWPASAGATIAWRSPASPGVLRVAADDGSAMRIVARSVTTFALAPAGDAVAYEDGRRTSWLALTTGARRRLRLPARASAGAAAWSPDGRDLAVARPPARRGAASDVLVLDRRGRVRSRVGLARGWVATGVAFAPDGRRLALTLTSAKQGARVVTVRRDGHGARGSVDAWWDTVLAPLWTTRGVVYKSGAYADEWSSQSVDVFGLDVAAPPWGYHLNGIDGEPRSPSDDGRRFAMAFSSCVWDFPARACAGGFSEDEIVRDLSRDGLTALISAGGRLERAPVGGGPRVVVPGVGPVGDAQWGDGGR